MTDIPPESAPAERASPAPTKAAIVLKLLARKRGATLTEITDATGWQAHSARAHLTRLRQAGKTLERVERPTGPAAYRLMREVAAEPQPLVEEVR